MKVAEASALIGAAVERGGTWADLGAGGGTFTRALAELLGASGRVIAVDADARALRTLRDAADARGVDTATIDVEVGDFHALDDVAALRSHALDGVLFANALHFTAEAAAVIGDAVRRVKPGGRIVVVEYDGRPASRWVPYPLGIARLTQLAATAALGAPRLLAERPSDYGGVMYAAEMRTPVDSVQFHSAAPSR